MKNWDVIIVGAGIIGLSLSLELRKRGMSVLVIERGEPAREASYAAAGMLADHPGELPAALHSLAAASARMYPEFAHELHDESGIDVDLRDAGTILLSPSEGCSGNHALPFPLAELEPSLAPPAGSVIYLKERSVNPRALGAAALKAARHRGVDISSGTSATGVLCTEGRAAGVSGERTTYHAPVVVNCAGAWSGLLPPIKFPTRPVKGQMLAVVGGPPLRHVIRSKEVYAVPRSDGRILIGSTLEEAGYDKRTDAAAIQQLHQSAVRIIPALGQARMLEGWAGLRPGTPDELPILGPTPTPGYFVATGHFRDGILLAPVTAQVMAQVVTGSSPEHDISAFAPSRFS